MAYSQWVLSTKKGGFYIHVNQVNSTMSLNKALRFTSFDAADRFAKEKGIDQVMHPVLYRECKDKESSRKRR